MNVLDQKAIRNAEDQIAAIRGNRLIKFMVIKWRAAGAAARFAGLPLPEGTQATIHHRNGWWQADKYIRNGGA